MAKRKASVKEQIIPSKSRDGDTNESSTTRKSPPRRKRKNTGSSSASNISNDVSDASSGALNGMEDDESRLISCLSILDPLLIFLTKATGKTLIPLTSLTAIIPKKKKSGNSAGVHSTSETLDKTKPTHPSTTSSTPNTTDATTTSTSAKVTSITKSSCNDDSNMLWNNIVQLHHREVLYLSGPWEEYPDKIEHITIGFPQPSTHFHPSFEANNNSTSSKNKKHGEQRTRLHGSTKAAARRRLAALKRSFKEEHKTRSNVPDPKISEMTAESEGGSIDDSTLATGVYAQGQIQKWKSKGMRHESKEKENSKRSSDEGKDAKVALEALERFLGEETSTKATSRKVISKETTSKEACSTQSGFILPKQAAYAGSNPERILRHGFLPSHLCQRIPNELSVAMGLQLISDGDGSISAGGRRKLYSHQASAIESIMNGVHTLICTGTGSGKSLCFLLPILADVMTSDVECQSDSYDATSSNAGNASIIIFPTKALAQDQLSKLKELIKTQPMLQKHIRPGIIDGDTPHADRTSIALSCNLILTNPDYLHATICPSWKKVYRMLLERIKFIVIDELHSYEGAFGAHVALVLSRLVRLCHVARETSCTTQQDNDKPPILFIGCSATIGHPEEHFRLLCPIPRCESVTLLTEDGSPSAAKHFFVWNPPLMDIDRSGHVNTDEGSQSHNIRCHAADETARILAHAIQKRIRCIAFCKTRALAEWVYERCTTTLKTLSSGESLSSRVEIYRGGYSSSVRRKIEGQLFRNELYGVVGTSALELGVDIGGIDLTLHCGYPGSISSLFQQAGRAGRGKNAGPSFSVTVCFSSPSEQHLWKNPRSLLCRGLDSPPSIPLNSSIVQGHLLCAASEFPIVGSSTVQEVLSTSNESSSLLPDVDLFGREDVYEDAVETLTDRGHIIPSNQFKQTNFITHPAISSPAMSVSLRSIEPINYAIVDTSHPLQGGRTDTIDENAIMDHIPYSRVFYHAYPGAIIMHRGRRYKIHSIHSPPTSSASSSGSIASQFYRYDSSNLGAFAKPTTARYSTRALSINHITVVKQLEHVEVDEKAKAKKSFNPPLSYGCVAGNGVVNVKKTVHGYTKLSLINRSELSRHEITVPPMEFDTNAIWIDCEASTLREVIKDFDEGVHALSHAICAVAPLFASCSIHSDIDCDHSRYECTRVLIFDQRAGGAGTTTQLWLHLFRPNGILEAAIELLTECPSCDISGSTYAGGCPGCIQAVPCINFQQNLSRTSALFIARRMLERLKLTPMYQSYLNSSNVQNKRQKLADASDLVSARYRSIVVGRPGWHDQPAQKRSLEGTTEDIQMTSLCHTNKNDSEGGGYI